MSHSAISPEDFDKSHRNALLEVTSFDLGSRVVLASDDILGDKENLIKTASPVSRAGEGGPNGALYDGWKTRRHGAGVDWAVIKLGTSSASISYIEIDTSFASEDGAVSAEVLALEGDTTKLVRSDDKRWRKLLAEVPLETDARSVFKLGDDDAKQQRWNALMLRIKPDGAVARFRAYGFPLPPAPLSALPDASVQPMDLLSAQTGARVVQASIDVAPSNARNLLLPGRGTDSTQGWETPRSRGSQGSQESSHWALIKMAAVGTVEYVEIDTAHHAGTAPLTATVEATLSTDAIPADSATWTTVINKAPIGPGRQHWLDSAREVKAGAVFSHVRLTIYPDGGVQRLRVFGHPLATAAPTAADNVLQLRALPLTSEAFAPYGSIVQCYDSYTSAQRGIDVTVINQGTGFKFARVGKIKDSYPNASSKGIFLSTARAGSQVDVSNGASVTIKTLQRNTHSTQAVLPMGKGSNPGVVPLKSGGAYLIVVAENGPDNKPAVSTLKAFLATAAQGISYNEGVWHHALFAVDGSLDFTFVDTQPLQGRIEQEKYTPAQPYASVRIPPYTAVTPAESLQTAATTAIGKLASLLPSNPLVATSTRRPIVPVPITREAFAPFGDVLEAYPTPSDRSSGVEYEVSADGHSTHYKRLANLTESMPKEEGAVTAISVFRASPKPGLNRGEVFDIRYMERHKYSSQAFVLLGKAEWEGKGDRKLPEGGQMIVIVAQGGTDDRPDPATTQAFILPSSKGIHYRQGAWHSPVLLLDEKCDLAEIDTYVSTGIPELHPFDVELLPYDQEPFGQLAVPLN